MYNMSRLSRFDILQELSPEVEFAMQSADIEEGEQYSEVVDAVNSAMQLLMTASPEDGPKVRLD